MNKEKHSENGQNLEAIKHPEKLCIVTTTRYPLFGSDAGTDAATVDNVRGTLALETFRSALKKGNQLRVSDMGSSPLFLEELKKLGVEVATGQSASRAECKRLLYRSAQEIKNVEAVVWIEPEKADMIEDVCMARCVEPILTHKADVVMPTRTQESWSTYPDYMMESEVIANEKCNALLRKNNLLKTGSPDIDHFFGPRMFANKPEIVDIFCEEYALDANQNSAAHTLMNPDIYSNSSYLPVVRALQEGYTVETVPIDFHYPETQRAIEGTMSSSFKKYRQKQRINIVSGMMQLFRLSKGQESRLKLL